MFALALSVFLALACCAAAGGPPAEYNVTMSDTATILRYSEPHNTTAAEGWNQTYTGSPWALYDPGELVEGYSQHITSLAGASVSVQFVGTGAYFLGSGQGSVALEVDGAQAYAGAIGAGGVVAGVGGLPYAAHTAKLSLTSGTLTFTNVSLSTIVGGNGAITVEQEITSLDSADNTNPELATLGKWQENNMFCGSSPSSVSCERYDCLSSDQPGASLKMAVPLNSSVAMMFGAVGSYHGPYSVVLDPAPPGMPANQSFTAAQAWLSNNKLMYYASLDPNTKYTIQIMYIGSSSQVIEWGKAVFVVGQGGEPWVGNVQNTTKGGDEGSGASGSAGGSTSGTPIGALVGGVVGGGVVLLGVIGGLIWWFCRRRKVEYTAGGEKLAMGGGKHIGRKNRWRHSVLSDFEVDHVDQTNQSGTVGTYHPMPDAGHAAAALMPPTAENTVTPLPAPWPADMVSYSGSSSSGYGGQGGKSSLSSPISPNNAHYNHSASTHETHAPLSAFTHGYPQYPEASGYPPSSHAAGKHTSPFVDPPAPALLPHTQTHMQYPPTPASKGRRPPVPSRPTIVTEAEDAGRVDAAPPVVEEQVPPRYNPAWADGGPVLLHPPT